MLNVYICEDDKKQLKMLKNRIDTIILIGNYDMKIALATTNPYEIIQVVKNSLMDGLYYIDIDLKCDINGFELAQCIREHDKRAFIVFITANDTDYKLALDYQCEALAYIVKDISLDGISEMLRKIAQTLYLADKRIHVDKKDTHINNYETISLEISKHKYTLKSLDDIVYIQKNKDNDHKLDVYGEDILIHANGSLKEILDQLDDRFIRVGKSLIINGNKVYEYDKKQRLITLNIGHELVSLDVSYQAMRNFLKAIYLKKKQNKLSKTDSSISDLIKNQLRDEFL